MADPENQTVANPYQTDSVSGKIPLERSRWPLALWVIAGVLFLGMAILLFLPARRSAPEAARRMVCLSTLRNLSIALLNYESTYGVFPPAYTIDDQGKPLHSWRTLILPFIDEHSLYESIDLSKPWDHPVNQAARNRVINVFTCPTHAKVKLDRGLTTYQAIVTDRSILCPGAGRSRESIVDGMSKTLLLIESDPSQAVHWMAPDDLDIKEVSLCFDPKQTHPVHNGGRMAVFADASTRFLRTELPLDSLDGLVTVDGSEVADLEDF